MKKMKIYLLALTALVAVSTFAQDKKKSSGGTTFGIGVEAGLPLSTDLKNNWNFGIGGSAKAAINVFEGGDVTLSAGYITFLGKSVTIPGVGSAKVGALGTIPLKAGLRFKLSEGFYGEPQLGYTFAKVSGSGSNSGNGNGFTYAAGVGYMMNQVDVGVRYEAWSSTGGGNTVNFSFLGLRVGYNFGK